MRRLPLLLALLLALLLGAAGIVAAAENTPERLLERELVRRVRWPVRIEPRYPGGCEGLAPRDVVVHEAGVRARVAAVEPSRLDTVHALLIDVSGSMKSRLGRAREAARAYIDGLPPDEPVMLASFSDNLRLLEAPTTDRARLYRGLEAMRVQRNTAWFDALRYVIEALAGRAERKVLVALTDGCDGMSEPGLGAAEIVDQAARVSNLTLFTVGLDLPSRCSAISVSGLGVVPADQLTSLAQRTGGAFFHVRSSSHLEPTFARIRALLDGEGFVSYVPPEQGPARRRVRIRSERGSRCRIVSAGPEVRHVAPQEVVQPTEASAPDGRVRLDEIVGERSQLYWPPALARERYRVQIDGRHARTIREVELPRVPFDRLLRHPRPAGPLLLRLLERGVPPFAAGATSRRDAMRARYGPGWTHGRTFIEHRGVLAAELYREAGYRTWADRRLAEARRREVDALIDEALRRGEVDRLRARELRETLVGTAGPVRPAELAGQLAAWLGDLDAREWAAELERWLIDRELTGDPAVEADIGRTEKAWPRLAAWFPPPTTVRVVTPLVPVHDTRLDAIGFFRVLLPTVEDAGPPRDSIPRAPLALRARGLLSCSGGLERVEYPALERRERRRARREASARRGDRLLTVRLTCAAGDVLDVHYMATDLTRPAASVIRKSKVSDTD